MGIIGKRARQKGNKSKRELFMERDVDWREKIEGIKGNEVKQNR